MISLLLHLAAAQNPPADEPRENEAVIRSGSYDWSARHRAIIERHKAVKPDLIFIGDSITHGWGGEPKANKTWDGTGHPIWLEKFAPLKATNLGFAGDQTGHVLWRLENGEIEGISPRVAVVMIGVNNVASHTEEAIAEAIRKIVRLLNKKLPKTQILLLGILPYGESPSPNRDKVKSINGRLKGLVTEPFVAFLDFGAKFLDPEGKIPKALMPDSLHLSLEGYRIWEAEMAPTLNRLLNRPR